MEPRFAAAGIQQEGKRQEGITEALKRWEQPPKITHQYGKIYTWEQMELKSFLDLAMFTDIKVPNAIFAAIAKKMALGTSV